MVFYLSMYHIFFIHSTVLLYISLLTLTASVFSLFFIIHLTWSLSIFFIFFKVCFYWFSLFSYFLFHCHPLWFLVFSFFYLFELNLLFLLVSRDGCWLGMFLFLLFYLQVLYNFSLIFFFDPWVPWKHVIYFQIFGNFLDIVLLLISSVILAPVKG